MCARSYLPAHFLQPRELSSLHHPRTQVGQHTSPGTLASQLAILCLGRSYFHFSVPDFNILSESFLRHFGFLWKASSKLLFSPRKLHFPRCKFQSKTLVHQELLSALFLGSKHQILPCISPLQEPGLHPLSSTLHTFPSCLAASLPRCFARPNQSFGPSRSGWKWEEAGSSRPAPSLYSPCCNLILLLTFPAFPREVLETVACVNNTPSL